MTRPSRARKEQRPLNAIVRIQALVSLVSVIAVGVLAIPSSYEVFRFPKEIWVRGETIVLLACWALLAIYGVRPPISKGDRPVLLFTAAALLWVWVTALCSTNRALSIHSALWASAIAVVFVTMYILARQRGRASDLWFLILPGCLNALLPLMQVP